MTYYLYYRFENTSPLRIADDSIAQKGQTATLHYIPGSTVRGLVISEIMGKKAECDKEKLFFETRFLNAYPVGKEGVLFPSPKGFYEDKIEVEGRKSVKNILKEEIEEGNLKRARLSEFCSAEGDTLFFHSVETGSDLKIRMENDDMFRNEYIEPGYVFEGTVASEDKGFLENVIMKQIGEEFYLGNGRSSGMGRCRLLSMSIKEDMPYKKYAVEQDMEQECYIMLLSPACMRNAEGESTGLDLSSLAEMMGVKDLKIKSCSTSVKEVMGYNRTWESPVPSVVMYDKGSVFRLTYDGKCTQDRAQELMNSGIGERRQEGFGRIIVLKDYTEWTKKLIGEFVPGDRSHEKDNSREDRELLKRIAEKYYRKVLEDAMDLYIIDNPLKKGTLGSSKTRAIEPILAMNRYDFPKARKLLEEYFGHEADKAKKQRVHQKLNSTIPIAEHVFAVLDGDLEELLQVHTRKEDSVMSFSKRELLKDEMGSLKIKFLLKELRYDGRKEDRK